LDRHSTRIVGMLAAHQIDATPWINQGGPNILAVKVTPERALQDVDGVELADSWYDWINWRYLGYRSPVGAVNNSFVADRNAGIWKPVYLRMSEDVVLGPGAVNTELPWPSSDSALLTVYTGVRNYSGEVVRGIIRATITRPGKPDIRLDKRVTLAAGQEREIALGPGEFPELRVSSPTYGGRTRWANPPSTGGAPSSAGTTARPTPRSCALASGRCRSTATPTAAICAGHRRQLLS
jgi:exo-1,4-beta-D-glucosaminidase